MLVPAVARPKDSFRSVIIDEHPVVRQGVRSLLESTWPAGEVTEAETLDGALDQLGKGKPDVVIIDPWRAGTDVAGTIKEVASQTKAPIVVFTSDGGARLLSEALKAGVKGYVRKDSPSDDLVRAIEAARGGEFYVDPGLSSTLVLDEGDRTLSARAARDPADAGRRDAD